MRFIAIVNDSTKLSQYVNVSFFASNFSNSFDAFFIAFELFTLNDGWTQYAFFNVQFTVCFNEGEAQ